MLPNDLYRNSRLFHQAYSGLFNELHKNSCLFYKTGSRDSVLVERRTRDRKVAGSDPGRSGGRIFFLRVKFVCLLFFGVRSNPELPQWHVKDPGRLPKVQVAGDT